MSDQETLNIVMFYHSLESDWNHGNAHFLRGVASELVDRGHDVVVMEPETGWSRTRLIETEGREVLSTFHEYYPELKSRTYDARPDLDEMLDGADLVLVHEWNDPELVGAIGAHRARSEYKLLFHDTHHRSVSAPDEMARYDLSHYDGVLAFGEVIRDIYIERAWAEQVWVWHEAADTRRFLPLAPDEWRDLVWIGNWGDGERTRQLREFLIEPVEELALRATCHGVRYPRDAREALEAVGIEYRGWLPNFLVPQVFASHAVTVHIPRQFYVTHLPGIPTIRPFEALACGIPLICSPWEDAEGLFRPGTDYLIARDGEQMRSLLRDVLEDTILASQLARSGLETIKNHHTCAHRVDELMGICAELGIFTGRRVPPAAPTTSQSDSHQVSHTRRAE